jgi:hypothetical protein
MTFSRFQGIGFPPISCPLLKRLPLKPLPLILKKDVEMINKKIPDKESLVTKLRFLINIYPIKLFRSSSIIFIYMGLQQDYPGLVSYNDLNTISKRKKTPEQIADAILVVWRRHETKS